MFSFYAGRSLELEACLVKAKKLNTNIVIINEFGDEPQTYKLNKARALCSDIISTPCHKSFVKWSHQIKAICAIGLHIGRIQSYSRSMIH